MQVVLAVVHFLHDVLFALDASLHLTIKLVLEAVEVVLGLVDLLVSFGYSIFDFLSDGVFKAI